MAPPPCKVGLKQIYFLFVSNLFATSFWCSLGIHQQESIDKHAEGDVLRTAENIFTVPRHHGSPPRHPLPTCCSTPCPVLPNTNEDAFCYTGYNHFLSVAVPKLLSSKHLMIKFSLRGIPEKYVTYYL